MKFFSFEPKYILFDYVANKLKFYLKSKLFKVKNKRSWKTKMFLLVVGQDQPFDLLTLLTNHQIQIFAYSHGF